jgi:AraC-like DNA-binding protein
MALCSSLSGTSPDELTTMMRPVGGDVVITSRGTFRSSAIRLDLSRLWMQHVEEELPRIWHTAASSSRAAVWFLTRPGLAVAYQGVEVRETDICLCPIGRPIWQRLTGPSHWGSMSLPLEDWATFATVADCDPFSSSTGIVLRPTASKVARLQRLHNATATLARDAPELIDHSEVARGIEQSLIDTMIECLQPSATGRTDIPAQRRSKIMRRFWEVLEESEDATIYLPELCLKLGVASRTLRAICHEYLGIGPKKYLLLRRMHLARRALRASDAADNTVSDIATEFGFWELGRFSVAYKALFGESPSSTLRQRP